MVKTKKPDSQIISLTDQLARSRADYANLEKRIEAQRELYVNLATMSIVDKLIGVLDDFDLAQKHLNDHGLKIAIDKFKSVLKSHGVEEIDTEGKDFDPTSMDCVDVADGKQNIVISTRRKGYKLNSQVVRPAQVIVGKGETKTN